MSHVLVELHHGHHLNNMYFFLVRHLIQAMQCPQDVCDKLLLRGEDVHVPALKFNVITLGVEHSEGDKGVGDGWGMEDIIEHKS